MKFKVFLLSFAVQSSCSKFHLKAQWEDSKNHILSTPLYFDRN